MTIARSASTPFFQHDGTLSESIPSYVTRSADADLLRHVLDGRFCFVLTSRQMGKSSLMIRTAHKLRELDLAVAIVDLTTIGTRISPGEWYFGIISTLAKELDLRLDTAAWWAERRVLAPIQRFNAFLETVVLVQIQANIIIFLDEIDSTLALDFTDDFFAAIRALYNQRASSAEYTRLTFVLLGVASPDDLIKDRSRTPFNIGQAIRLREFTPEEAEPLRQGLARVFGEQAGSLIERVFYWTSGHPYLTQKLCARIASRPDHPWDAAEVDSLVAGLFFQPDFGADSNLASVRNAVEAEPAELRRELLSLYSQVYKGSAVVENELSPVQNRLKLLGLARAERGVLLVRNQIYRRVFDLAWVRAHTPVSWRRRIAIGTLLAAVLAVALVFVMLSEQAETARAAQITSLAKKCRVDRADASALFFANKTADAQHDIFQVGAGRVAAEDFVEVAYCLEPGLNTPGRQELRRSICCGLQRIGDAESQNVARSWGCTDTCGD